MLYTRDTNVVPHHMTVGKAKAKEYVTCHDESPDVPSDNGCGAMACIKTGQGEDKAKERSGDYLLITGGIFTKSKTGPVQHAMNDYYCGNGLGEDHHVDGKDMLAGVLSQAPGPVAIR